ncbi:hypothetical protein GQ53DRAFT_396215 [Thozetella sp. PMI_491]|nr:hypothetical protein GQ53DRAFT_396215 [Thozetella sp. PMI_491]
MRVQRPGPGSGGLASLCVPRCNARCVGERDAGEERFERWMLQGPVGSRPISPFQSFRLPLSLSLTLSLALLLSSFPPLETGRDERYVQD